MWQLATQGDVLSLWNFMISGADSNWLEELETLRWNKKTIAITERPEVS